MATLDSIKRAAYADVFTCVDDTTPAGHFMAIADVDGAMQTYLLEGNEGDLSAAIKGRIESRGPNTPIRVYKGDGVRGGERGEAFVSTRQSLASLV